MTATMTKQGFKIIPCLVCDRNTKVDNLARRVTCPDCVAKLAGAPDTLANRLEPTLNKDGTPRAKRGEGKKYVPSGFPRGWHKKIHYIHTDGTEWSKGKALGI